MNRRALLKTVGASVLTGAAISGTASASDGDPRVVDVESGTNTDDPDGDDKYSVEYPDDGTVEISGSAAVGEPCYEAEIVGIESTRFGDVVRVTPNRYGELCAQLISRLHFRIELEYEDASNDVFLEFVDE